MGVKSIEKEKKEKKEKGKKYEMKTITTHKKSRL
jgi:hypothetical protein